jgi:16S rRNA processing protein RimM
MKESDVRVGTIVKPHGVEGAVLVDILTDFPEERFGAGAEVTVLTDRGRETFTVREGSRHQERWIMQLDEVRDRDEAEQLRGADLVVDESEVIGAEGDLYDFDLVGMDVYDQDDQPMGEIREVGRGANRPTLRIERPDGDTIEFPAHEELALDADRHEKWIRLKFQQGWERLVQES